MKDALGFVMMTGHFDIEWYQPMRSYRFWLLQTFDLLDEAAREADMPPYMLDGQVFPLEEYLELRPDRRAWAERLVREGKLSVGPFYTQFDEWLPSAESMVRSCLWGARRSAAFGRTMRAGYLPDNFGHPRQLPQILAGFGIRNLMFMRGMPEVQGLDADEFWYEGLDGTRLLTTHLSHGYANAVRYPYLDIPAYPKHVLPYYREFMSYDFHTSLASALDAKTCAEQLVENAREQAPKQPSGVAALIAGFDHLPPQKQLAEALRLANAAQDEVRFVSGDAEAYANELLSRAPELGVCRAELTGSFNDCVLLGALTTRMPIKRLHFACEALLERYAEPLAAVARRYGLAQPRENLREAWRFMLINSAHDTIHGACLDEVHLEAEARYRAVTQIAAGTVYTALSDLSKRLARLPGAQWELLGYAPSQGKAQAFEVALPVGDAPVSVEGADGTRFPAQVLDAEPIEQNGLGQPRNAPSEAPEVRHLLVSGDFARGSFPRFAVRRGGGEEENPFSCSDTRIENEFLIVEARGALLRVTDKRTGNVYDNLNLLEDDADAGDVWDFSEPWIPGRVSRTSDWRWDVTCAEHGPVRATLRIEGSLWVPERLAGDARVEDDAWLPMTFLVSLYRGQANVRVTLRFENRARDHRLRLRAATRARAETVVSQGHFAVIERPVELPKPVKPWAQPPTRFQPCREWAAASDGARGLAVAMKGVTCYEAERDPMTGEVTLYMTLLRCVGRMSRDNLKDRRQHVSDSHLLPGAQCLGEHEIEWAYLPYAGGGLPFLAEAEAFLYPPAAIAVRTRERGEQTALPRAFGWTEENLRFSALKDCEDDDAAILRVYEDRGVPTAARVYVGEGLRAFESTLNEDTGRELEVANGFADVQIGAYQCLTLKLMRE